MSQLCFVPGRLLVPGEGVSPEQWACPSAGALSRESWRELEARRENAPGAMQLLVPDALLQRVETRERLATARAAMGRARELLPRTVNGFVYLERTLPDGRVRRGLVGCVDLEAYDFAAGSRTPVRAPSALAARQVLPRLECWEDAALQSSHILLAANMDEAALFAAAEGIQNQALLYEGPLCYGGGSVKGWAVESADRLADEAELRELAADGNTGVLLHETNEDLFRGLAGADFLPLGLFAPLEAQEQRYELECRYIR